MWLSIENKNSINYSWWLNGMLFCHWRCTWEMTIFLLFRKKEKKILIVFWRVHNKEQSMLPTSSNTMTCVWSVNWEFDFCVILQSQQHVFYLLLSIFFICRIWMCENILDKKKKTSSQLFSLSFNQSCWSPYDTIDAQRR